eukprot:9470613-Pyramimonas_sp.AAC.1
MQGHLLQRDLAEAYGESHRQGRSVASVSTYLHATRARHRPRSQRRTETPVSARSGSSAISERGMLHTVLMVNTDGQMGMRADEVTSMNMPTTPVHVSTPGIFEKSFITEEEARGYMNVLASLS